MTDDATPLSLQNKVDELFAHYLPPYVFYLFCSSDDPNFAVQSLLSPRYTPADLVIPQFGPDGNKTFWEHFDAKYHWILEEMGWTEAQFCSVMAQWPWASPDGQVLFCEEHPELCQLLAYLPP